MKLSPTGVHGCVLVELEPHVDNRGFFARTFDAKLFAEAGLEPGIAQANLSFNHKAGTVRGLHRQVPPHAEAKLVRCIRGAIVDVAVDLREDSETFGQHVMVQLSAANRLALYVPPYVFHGFQTLVDDTEVAYQVSGPYTPGAEEALRYDDAQLGLQWPRPVTVVSEKDAAAPTWTGRPLP
jgi:dTDP-4-dehydrorhamnose 3,5-epimerase